ncbi:MAG: TolC family protein [Candidatus Omnitrophica bacterium]|nr:TolC family protein [Candidatus Omnitrophota bacterium]
MSKKIYLIVLVFFFLLTAPIGIVYSEGPEGPVAAALKPLIEEALKNNPEVQSAYNLWQAAVYKIREVGGLPDPRAGYGYYGENIETRVGPMKQKYDISQKIPFPGKLSAKARAQAKRAEALQQGYEAVKREVIKNVKFTFYDIFWTDKAIQINEEEKFVLESLEKVAQRRYAANLAPQQDVIKAQVEITKLINRLYLLRRNRKSLAAKLNTILNRPVTTAVDKNLDIGESSFGYGLDELHKIAQTSRQELLAANLDTERAEYEKSLARLDYFPDFTFGFDYIQVGSGHTTMPNDGQDAWLGKVAINVPIWFDRLGAKLKEKKARLAASRSHYQNIENSISYEVEDVYYKITTYKDIVSLYRTALIPQAEQSFEAAKIGYETGSVDFLNWLDAERVLLQTRLAYYRSVVDYQKSIAYLERVVGEDIEVGTN